MSQSDGEPRASSTTLPLPSQQGSATSSADESAWIGRVIAGRYHLERVIGRGGMGLVFEATHVAVGRRVAVKILRPEAARSAEAVARFHREARAAASIGHRNIVEVLDFGHGDDGAYLVMELLEGADLASIVRKSGALPVARAVGIARQVADGLRAAHERGIVHRDLKSGNVFVSQREGRDLVKILDFGVSKVIAIDDTEAPSTREGALLGTPHTMAPEQGTDGRFVDHRVDLYALGCILFEMLTGELPFTGTTPVEVLYKHVHESPRRPSSVRGDGAIPRALDDLVVKLLAKDRERRHPDAQRLIEAIDRIDLGRRRTRVRLALLALSSIALVVVVALVGATSTHSTARVQSPRPLVVKDVSVEEPEATPEASAVARALDATAPAAVLTVVVSPVNAVVRVDGVITPSPEGVLVQRATQGQSFTVRAEAPGHASREERVRVDGDTTVRWSLPESAVVRVDHDVRPRSVQAAMPRVRVTDVVDASAPRLAPPDGLKTSPYHRDGG